jgi:hypothetical protein
MKKLLSLTLVAAMVIGFASCKKSPSGDTGLSPFNTTSNNTTAPVVDPLAQVGAVPTGFTHKVLIEEFTGEWCGFCPDGGLILDGIVSGSGGKIYGAAIHDKDWLVIDPFYTQIQVLMPNTYGFPGGTANRRPYNSENIFSRGDWGTAANNILAEPAECGLAMVTKEKNDMLDVQVFMGYNAKVNKSTKITLYLIEDAITPVNQNNAPAGYLHEHVVRACFTSTVGDDVTLTDAKKYTIKDFKGLDIAGLYKDKANLHVLAFVNVNGATEMNHEILNVQQAGLNEVKKWD